MKKVASVFLAFMLIVNIWIFTDNAYLQKAEAAQNIIRVVRYSGDTTDFEAFDVDITNGSFTNVTSTFLANIVGTDKPFHKYNATLGMAYIGNNKVRVVRGNSEWRAFDVDLTTGNYVEVTNTFLVNNYGDTSKPFYYYNSQSVLGMAYIGNNKLRVVRGYGYEYNDGWRAFDVDITDGSYTDVTSSFLNTNNTGDFNKPFYTFRYPTVLGMASIANGVIRVVANPHDAYSDWDAYNIDVNNGSYSNKNSGFLYWEPDPRKNICNGLQNGYPFGNYYNDSMLAMAATWDMYNSTPIINLTTSDNQALGELATFDVTTSDEDAGDTLTYTISAGSTPGGTEYNGGLSHLTGIYRGTFTVNFDTSVIPSSNLVWNGTKDEEVVYITATVDDGKGGSDTKSMSFIVYNNRPTVNIISPNDNDWKN